MSERRGEWCARCELPIVDGQLYHRVELMGEQFGFPSVAAVVKSNRKVHVDCPDAGRRFHGVTDTDTKDKT